MFSNDLTANVLILQDAYNLRKLIFVLEINSVAQQYWCLKLEDESSNFSSTEQAMNHRL